MNHSAKPSLNPWTLLSTRQGARHDRLLRAHRTSSTAQAVVDRWDTPLWKDAPHTATFIKALKEALLVPDAEPVAIAEVKKVHGHICQFLNRTPYGMKTIKNGDLLYATPQPAAVPEKLTVEEVLAIRRGVTTNVSLSWPQTLAFVNDLEAAIHAKMRGCTP